MPSFKVIRASAGSGKTFNLTSEYLCLLFAETDAFRHILAVTFTNKATEEMKSRIINELHLLASDKVSNQLPVIIKATGLTERQIRNKAIVILKKLLHQYTFFSVTTIDTFFQRIIRSFTRELGIQEGYSIELDIHKVLSEVIDRLLMQAGNDASLLSWLTMFAESLIEKGESWNLRKGIFNLGKEIFKEEFFNLDDAQLKLFADREFLNAYKTELHTYIHTVEKNYRAFGDKAIQIIEKANLEVDNFSNKSRGPAGFLVSLAEGVFREPTATAIQAVLVAEKWCTANSPLKNKIITLASSDLMPLMQQVADYYRTHCKTYHTALVIVKNLYTLGILVDISKLTVAWCAENNTFILPEAPSFLNKIINDNDTPFIYEKAGYWYHHFMIDEFQDTSLLQWSNFKPLISNSLSQEYNNLAVGDAKQSIYRWRNSSWEILEDKINDDFLPGVLEQITLKQNWRSSPEIIQFNNLFFKSAAGILDDECVNPLVGTPDGNQQMTSVSTLYRDIEQEPGQPETKKGHVRLEFLSSKGKENFYDAANRKLLDQIYELLEKGYQLGDIAVLTRKNDEAARIADFLISNNGLNNRPQLSVISDDALRIGSSVLVNFIVAFLRHIDNPKEPTTLYYLFSVYNNYLKSEHKEWNEHPIFSFPDGYNDIIESARSYSLIELTEKIIKIFNLHVFSGEKGYLMALNDMVMEYSKNHSNDIRSFLDYWNETGSDKTLSAPAGQNAIRILTLHKAKGLEFKATIIPYCNWELVSFNKSFLWCHPDLAPFNKLPILPLLFSKQLENTIFSDDYSKELYRQYVDNLNLLYVAFTRAKEVLCVYCHEGDSEKMKTVSDLAARVLGNIGFTDGTISFVSSTGIENKYETLIPDLTELQTIYERLKIAYQGKLVLQPNAEKPSRPVNVGKTLHDIFRLIENKDDIPMAVDRLYLQGKIARDELIKYNNLIGSVLNNVQVASWFGKEWKVFNEAEIILPMGIIKRPDRVITDGNRTIIIDYKFGQHIETSNETQIAEYAHLLIEMGYRQVEAWLWYVILGKVIQIQL